MRTLNEQHKKCLVELKTGFIGVELSEKALGKIYKIVMSEKAKMPPKFNLKKALSAGGKCKTRDGRSALIVRTDGKETDSMNRALKYSLEAEINGTVYAYTMDGLWGGWGNDPQDLLNL